MLVFVFAFLTFCSTFFGGLFSLKFKKSLRFIMSFTAGVLLGVVAFDLLPEITTRVQQGSATMTGAMIALVAGFLVFHTLEKTILIHHSHEDSYATHKHPHVGIASAIAPRQATRLENSNAAGSGFTAV